MILAGKRALITGASRGIGRAISDLFAQEGAEIWGLGSREAPDHWTGGGGGGGGKKSRWITADLGDLANLEALIEGAVKEAGGFDILVSNAGITRDNLSFRMSLADFQKVLDVNLTAAFLLARVVGRDMIRRRQGAILFMSSVVGLHGNGGQANYAASKAGLVGLTKSLAQEVAGRGVRVNAIAPGFIDTDMTAALPEEVRAKMLERIPLKRMGAAGDVAQAALFLASDAAAYITGQVLSVDGGMFL